MKVELLGLVVIAAAGLAIFFFLKSSATSAVAEPANDETNQQLVSISEFTDLVIAELASRNASFHFNKTEPDSVDFQFAASDEPVVVFTGNIYEKYEAQPDQLEQLVTGFVDVAMQAFDSRNGAASEISADRLAIVLRHTDYLEYSDAEKTVWQEFHGDLIALMVFNFPDHLTNVTKGQVDLLGLTEESAWALAAENLRTQKDDLIVLAENQGAKVISAENGLATGHLWLLCEQTPGQNFDSMVINKDSYMIADMNDETATTTLAGIAAKFVNEDNTLSTNLVSCFDGKFYASKLDGNSWVPILPE